LAACLRLASTVVVVSIFGGGGRERKEVADADIYILAPLSFSSLQYLDILTFNSLLTRYFYIYICIYYLMGFIISCKILA